MLIKKKNGLLILIILLSSILYLIGTHYSMGLSHDSFHYLYSAKNFYFNFSLKDYNQSSFVHWPPIYPVIISIFCKSTSNGITLIKWFHLVILVISILFSYKIALCFFDKIKQQLFTLILSALSLPLIYLNSFILSDGLFLCLMLILIERYFHHDFYVSTSRIYTFLFVLSLLPLVRVVGIFFIIAFTILFVIDKKVHLTKILVYFSLVIIPFILWILWVKTSTSGFEREVSIHREWLLSIKSTISAISNWYLPNKSPFTLKVLLFIIFIFTLGRVIQKESIFFRLYIILITYFLCINLLFIVLQPATPIEERYFMPIYVIFILLVVYLVYHIKFTQKYSLLILSLFVIYQITRTTLNITQWSKRGVNFELYQKNIHRESISYLENRKNEKLTIYCNKPHILIGYVDSPLWTIKKVDIIKMKTIIQNDMITPSVMILNLSKKKLFEKEKIKFIKSENNKLNYINFNRGEIIEMNNI